MKDIAAALFILGKDDKAKVMHSLWTGFTHIACLTNLPLVFDGMPFPFSMDRQFQIDSEWSFYPKSLYF